MGRAKAYVMLLAVALPLVTATIFGGLLVLSYRQDANHSRQRRAQVWSEEILLDIARLLPEQQRDRSAVTKVLDARAGKVDLKRVVVWLPGQAPVVATGQKPVGEVGSVAALDQENRAAVPEPINVPAGKNVFAHLPLPVAGGAPLEQLTVRVFVPTSSVRAEWVTRAILLAGVAVGLAAVGGFLGSRVPSVPASSD